MDLKCLPRTGASAAACAGRAEYAIAARKDALGGKHELTAGPPCTGASAGGRERVRVADGYGSLGTRRLPLSARRMFLVSLRFLY